MFFDLILSFQQTFGGISWLGWLKDTSGIEIAIKLVILYLVILWIAFVVWVARDAINRSNSIVFHVFSILLNIFLPVFGLVIYLLVRSPRTLLDRYYEDLEFQSLSNETKDFCHKCNAIIGQDYRFCGECGEELMCKCVQCNKEYFKRYKNCPYCGHKKGKKSEKAEEEINTKSEKYEKNDKSDKDNKSKK